MANINYPATNLASANLLLLEDSNTFHNILNGDSTESFNVDEGTVPSVRKALVDNFYYKNPTDWVEATAVTEFNQLVKFTDNSLWYAPSARSTNPILMGATPVGDALWIPSPFSPAGLADFVTVSSITPTSGDGVDGDVWFLIP